MSSEQSEHERRWRDYQTEGGARPIKDFLSLEGFQKKTQQTPESSIRLAEQRLADWRRRGKARRASQEN